MNAFRNNPGRSPDRHTSDQVSAYLRPDDGTRPAACAV